MTTSEVRGYDRNHGAIPHIDGSKHILTITSALSSQFSEPTNLSVSDLKTLFPQHTVTCALQCAGNRRHTMRTQLKEVQGIDWYDGAVMNCVWRGPRLRDVLLHMGAVKDDKSSWEGKHVAFACYQTECQEDSWYGASIELSRAMRGDMDVILALDMNGSTLAPSHGFPIRVIAPGIAGARCVKWLDRITVQDTESKNHYQQFDYKVLPPEAEDKEKAKDYWGKTPAIQDMPVNSIIGVPQSGNTIQTDKQGFLEVRGYALPSGEYGPVTKVEVSADDGHTWTEATIDPPDLSMLPDEWVKECMKDEARSFKWAWVLWRTKVKIEKGQGRRIWSKATDKAGNVQEPRSQWNLRGVAYSGYGEARDLNVE